MTQTITQGLLGKQSLLTKLAVGSLKQTTLDSTRIPFNKSVLDASKFLDKPLETE